MLGNEEAMGNCVTCLIVIGAKKFDAHAYNHSYPAIDIQYDNKTEQASLRFEQDLAQGSMVQLEIQFEGVLNDHMSGFYRSSYKDKNGDTKYYRLFHKFFFNLIRFQKFVTTAQFLDTWQQHNLKPLMQDAPFHAGMR